MSMSKYFPEWMDGALISEWIVNEYVDGQLHG